jgi:hypothetical protein
LRYRREIQGSKEKKQIPLKHIVIFSWQFDGLKKGLGSSFFCFSKLL